MTELLAPAGSYESLVAAVNAGADAVYMGGTRFGARAYAQNPETDRFIDGIRYAHRYGSKVYMTVNTLFKPGEIKELKEYIKPYYHSGVDAVLVQDLGALKVLRESYPDLPIHASTQMTVANVDSAIFLKRLGLTRVVPARELSLAEIKKIRDEAQIEVETFVHGALCYCYSGQCLMSSLIGGRSGNRGRCAQPCRLEYEACGGPATKTLLSLKDLCSIDFLPQLVRAGIDSFKIEGRMKSPRYTAGVTEVWRKYIDLYERSGENGYRVDPKDRKMLSDLYDRGGFTEGYYFEHNGKDMMAWEDRRDRFGQNEDLYEYLDDKYVNSIRKIFIEGRVLVRQGCELELNASAKGHKPCRVTMNMPDRARNRALTEGDIIKQLEKTGGTCFEWTRIEVDTDGESFVPVGVLNELRRGVLTALQKEIDHESERIVQ
ncbi:MAG: U32 family peptidase [Lachnospiraceae bacterium]|nr:U32 family peptidase [Lachnospiraceae bacterium]